MASKKETLELVLAVLISHEASAELTAELTELLAPKSGGAAVVIEDVFNEADNTILCSVSGVWLPATTDYFYAEKAEGKGIKGLKRVSKQGESIRKSAVKVLTATEKGIMTDVLGGDMSPEDGQAALNTAKAVKPDYSGVGIIADEPEEA